MWTEEAEAKSITGGRSLPKQRHRICGLILILTTILSAFSIIILKEVPTAGAEILGSNIRVDDTGMDSSDQNVPSIVTSSDGTIYVAWDDERNDNLFEDIYVTRSLDGGQTFGEDMRINDNTGLSRRYGVDIATDSTDRVHAVWIDWRNDADGMGNWPSGGVDGKNNADIYYSNSTDGGRSWSPNLTPSNTSRNDLDTAPSIAVDSKDSIHVVWEAILNGSSLRYIFYSNSTNNGMSFSEPWRIDNSNGTSVGPSIAIDENDVIYVVWEDYRNITTRADIWFTKSMDGGLTFEGYRRVNTDTSPVGQTYPRISARKLVIGIVWAETGLGWNISFTSSFDGGASFSEAAVVNDNVDQVTRDFPSIWINESQYISIAWETKKNGNLDICFANSTDGGGSFSANQRVNDDLGTAPQAGVDLTMDSNGYVYLVWSDWRNGNGDIYFARAPPQIADLEPIDISFNPPSPVTEWTIIDLNATIRNNGDREATNVLVRFFDGDSSFDVQIGLDQILPGIDANGGIGYAEAQWIATPGGLHTIYVVVDPENNVTESNETNNVATENISVISLRPPTLVQAVLTGNGLENVTLNWSLSPDDGMGSRTVTGYKIFRNMTYNSEGLSYSLIAILPNGTSTFTDPGVGEGNPNNYFYRVCARDVNNTTVCSRTQAGKFTRPLIKGLNLLSAPLIQADESIEMVLQTVEFDKAWTYDSFAEKWKWYMTFKPYKGELRSINETKGFWVNATEDCNFTIAGIVPIQTNVHLNRGWNLVGFPSFQQDYTVADLKADVTAGRIEGFDASAPPYFLRLMLGGDILETGYGYWLNVAAETT